VRVPATVALEQLNPTLPAEAINWEIDELPCDPSAISLAAANSEVWEMALRTFFLIAREFRSLYRMGCQIDEIQDISLDAVYGHVKRTFLGSPGAEGVFVPCGQFTVPHIAELESDIGALVIAATYADIWAGLRMINVKTKISGRGKLLQTLGDQI
jgi:hypothetical protein